MIRALRPPGEGFHRRRILMCAAVAAAALLGAAVYGTLRFPRNASEARCDPAVALARRVAPLAHGEVAAFTVAEEPMVVPDLAFFDGGGVERHLSEWHGRTVLLNLWATWCVPCRKEMPELNTLQEKLGGPGFEVVAVNIDTRDAEKPRAWLKTAGVDKLAYYADSSAKVFQVLKKVGRAPGLPTSLVIDPAGCEIGTIAGPAEWASADALTLITAALDGEADARARGHSPIGGQAAN
jgi:thiol-disulfide isomerase/thioredoxin